ncbi:MAG: macro domain-containing protein [Eubacteriales bacterium]|nr:macro domain-containing protein [Eubacteriales bacterium]
MPYTIIRQDITKMRVDAIVNAANTRLKQGGGVCGALFRAAGAEELRDACEKLAPIAVGEAVITPGFGLPAKHIIHTAGPVYQDGQHGEEALLHASYLNSIRLAKENGCESVAFPLISSGVYGYPKREALRVATAAIREFLEGHDMDVYLAVFDTAAFAAGEELMGQVASFIDENYVSKHAIRRQAGKAADEIQSSMPDLQPPTSFAGAMGTIRAPRPRKTIDEMISRMDEPFSQRLFQLIDEKGWTDPEVYKRANLDRKLFSKIRTGKNQSPSKRTALALAVALELSLPETDDLLKRAGHALSRSQKFGVIVTYFLVKEKYDIYEINEVLFAYGQPLLGGS